MKKILFFSNNIDKIKEIKNLFKNLKIEICSPKDFNITIEPKEIGSSFSENAKLKSCFGYKYTQLPCFADDSGICIEALRWKPNVLSKRFMEKFKSKNDCFKYIIDKVTKTNKDKACFKTSICLTLKSNYHVVFEGLVKGTISKEIKGENGFGYDPIFIPNGLSKTYGELNIRKKEYFEPQVYCY